MKKNKVKYYEEMEKSAIGELCFSNTQTQELLEALNAIEDMGDPLITAFVKNTKEKHNINKMVHARRLFPLSRTQL